MWNFYKCAMLGLLAQVIDHKITLRNQTFCAPGTLPEDSGNSSVCALIACDAVDTGVCPTDSCEEGSATELTKCSACASVNYVPENKTYGLCAYKCLRNSTMTDCFFLLGEYFCYGGVQVPGTEPDSVQSINAYCEVCQNGFHPTANALSCEEVPDVAGTEVIGCLKYEKASAEEEEEVDPVGSAKCVDCGIGNCTECINGTVGEMARPECGQCKFGFPLYGECSNSIAGCAKYESGSLRCVECANGFELFVRQDGFPACTAADINCGGIAEPNESCILTVDELGLYSYALQCTGFRTEEGHCIRCDCSYLTQQCASYCGVCPVGLVYSLQSKVCASQKPGVFEIRFCETLNGSLCSECIEGYKLVDGGHGCSRVLTKCGTNEILVDDVACVCNMNFTRNDLLECVLAEDACGSNGILRDGACSCAKRFTGEFCEFCASMRVFWNGECVNYRSIEKMWYAFLAIVWILFICVTITLWVRGWCKGVFRRPPRDVSALKDKKSSDSAKKAAGKRPDAEGDRTGLRVVF